MLSVIDKYRVIDPHNWTNWILKPGYEITVEQTLDERSKEGRELAVEHLKKTAEEKQLQPQDKMFAINKWGFKGPDFPLQKTKTRIICLGDSTTFGSHYDSDCYPRALERVLHNVEVINAGVLGYRVKNMLAMVDYYAQFKPDIALIYLGWNDLFADIKGIKSLYLYKAIKSVVDRIHPQERKFTDHYWNTTEKINYEPSFFEDVIRLAKKLKSNWMEPVFLTLPCLYSTNSTPTEEMLSMGHLPLRSKNAYVFAQMVESYNLWVRRFGELFNVRVIDTAKWAERELDYTWYFDSLHLKHNGQIEMANYIAGYLEIYR